jgi:hypothetical protein
MWRTAALYLAHEFIDLSPLLPDAQALGSPVHSWMFEIEGNASLFNVVPGDEIAEHLKGFSSYLESRRSLDGDEAVNAAQAHIERCLTVMGLVILHEFDADSATANLLRAIAEKFDGVIFVGDSVVRADGRILCGPLLH